MQHWPTVRYPSSLLPHANISGQHLTSPGLWGFAAAARLVAGPETMRSFISPLVIMQVTKYNSMYNAVAVWGLCKAYQVDDILQSCGEGMLPSCACTITCMVHIYVV